MSAVVFRNKQVGPYTVTELPMRLHLQVLKDFPDGGLERASGYLGYAVSNGTGEPIGRDAVLELPPAWFNQLMDAYMQVSQRIDLGTGEALAEGNA